MNKQLETVFNVCNAVRNNITQKISFHSLLSRLRREFQKHNIELYLRSSRTPTLGVEEFYVNAYYDSEDDLDNEIPIEVIIYHNFDKSVLWDHCHTTGLLIQVYDAVVHELCHQRQSRLRCHRMFWPHSSIVLQYLSDPDEIDAYALSITIELCRSLGKERSLRHLSKFKKISKFKIQRNLVSPNLFAFVKVFDEIDEMLLRRLIKKVYKKLIKIDTDAIFM